MQYILVYYDGNTGAKIKYPTIEEAIREAEIKWDHLTDHDKARYSDKRNGGFFMIIYENGLTVRDFTRVE